MGRELAVSDGYNMYVVAYLHFDPAGDPLQTWLPTCVDHGAIARVHLLVHHDLPIAHPERCGQLPAFLREPIVWPLQGCGVCEGGILVSANKTKGGWGPAGRERTRKKRRERANREGERERERENREGGMVGC